MTEQPTQVPTHFAMPNCFEHLQRNAKLEVLKSDTEKGKYKTLRLQFYQRQGQGLYQQAADIAPDLEDMIALYRMLSNKESAENKLQIHRKGKALTIERSRAGEGRPSGLFFGAYSSLGSSGTEKSQVNINLPPYQCIYLSGIMLSCIAENMGCDPATANSLINRWY